MKKTKKLGVFLVILLILLGLVFSITALTPKTKKAEGTAAETGVEKNINYGNTGIMVTSKQKNYLDSVTGSWDFNPNKGEFYGTGAQAGQTIIVYDMGEIVHNRKPGELDVFMFSDGEKEPLPVTITWTGENKYSYTGEVEGKKFEGEGEMIKEGIYVDNIKYMQGKEKDIVYINGKNDAPITEIPASVLGKALTSGAEITEVSATEIKFGKEGLSGTITKTGDVYKTEVNFENLAETKDVDESLNSYTEWSTGLKQTKKQEKDGKVSVGKEDYYIDKKQFDEKTGTCKVKACFYEDAKALAAGKPNYAFYLKQTPYGFGKVEEKSFKDENPMSREIEILSGPNKGARITQSLDGKGTKPENVKSDTFYNKEGYPEYNTDYKEGERELNSRRYTVGGYIDNGVSVCSGCTPNDWDQKSKAYYFSEDGDWVGTDWEDKDKDGEIDFNELTKPFKSDEDEVDKQDLPDDTKKAIKDGLSTQSWGRFWAGEQEWQKWGQSILSQRGWHSLSSLFFGDIYTFEYARKIDQAFSKMIVSEDWYESKACEAWVGGPPKTPGESVAVIETPSGTYQAVASIQAEKTKEKVPIFCMGEDDVCPEDYTCEDGFCYGDGEEPAQGKFYKITWGVTAPRDEKLTPYIDEDGVSVSFNVRLNPGNILLYEYDGKKIAKAIRLENGASDKDTIVHYSVKDYDEVCIVWAQAPNDRWRGPIGNVCVKPIPESEKGQVEWSQSGQQSSGGSQSVNEGEVTRDMDW